MLAWIFLLIFAILSILLFAAYRRNARRCEDESNAKHKKRKSFTFILMIASVTAAVICLPFAAFYLFQPLSRPDRNVRNYVLKRLPIGTSMDEALKTIEQNGWSIKQTNTEYGLRINDRATYADFATQADLSDTDNDHIRIVGSQSMYAELGEYHVPLDTVVSAYFAFDENGRLAEIVIRRDIDAL